MTIYAERGAKVRYTGEAGYDIDHAIAGKSGLKVGGVYTVDFTAVGRNSTEVYLEEVKGVGFNSVIFEDVPGEEPRLDKDAHGPPFKPEPQSSLVTALQSELAEKDARIAELENDSRRLDTLLRNCRQGRGAR